MSQLMNAEVNGRVTIKPTGGEGYSGFQVDDRMGTKIKTPKTSVGLPRKPPKIPRPKINPEKIPRQISEP